MEQFGEMQAYIGMGDVLIKADAKDKDVIYITASNEKEDSQGETILRKALEDEANNFLKRGVISFDHLHKIKNDPEYIIGEPLDVKFTENSNATLVKARLYTKKNKHAQTVRDLADEGSTRLGASVGGGILGRKQVFDGNLRKARKYIVKVLWDEVAITHKPVNEYTLGSVSMMPFAEFQKAWMSNDAERVELLKALMAGTGTDASTMSGGRTLIPESLRGTDGWRNREEAAEAQRQKILKANSELMGTIVKNVLKSRRDYTTDMLKSTLREHGYADERSMYAILPTLTDLVKYIQIYMKGERA